MVVDCHDEVEKTTLSRELLSKEGQSYEAAEVQSTETVTYLHKNWPAVTWGWGTTPGFFG